MKVYEKQRAGSVMACLLLLMPVAVCAQMSTDWMKIWGSAEQDYVYGAARSRDMDITYVCGETYGAFGEATNISGNGQAFLCGLSASGSSIWTRIFGSTNTDTACDVAVDQSTKDIYVAGHTMGAFGLGQTNHGLADVFLVRFDETGDVEWARVWGSPQDDMGKAVAVDQSDGSVYVAGWTYGVFDGQSKVGMSDLFLSKFRQDGVRLWSRIWGSTNADEGTGVALSSFSNANLVCVSGGTWGSFDGQTAPGSGDACLTAFDRISGTSLWTRIWGSPMFDLASAVTVPDQGEVIYVTGETAGAFGAGQTNHGGHDIFLTSFSLAGSSRWSRVWGSYDDEHSFAVSSDIGGPTGKICVAGSTWGSFDGQTNPYSGMPAFCFSMIRYDGVREFSRIWGTTGSDYGQGLAASYAGDVYVAGYTDGNSGVHTNPGGNSLAVTRWLPTSPGDVYVSHTGAHIWPYATWANAATSIHEGLNAALGGSTVRVDGGNYVLTAEIAVTDDIHMIGVDGPAMTFIDGQNMSRCLYMDEPNARVEGFTLMNGSGSGYGGGAYINAGALYNCVVVDNFASVGAGVYLASGELRNCLVFNNHAVSEGGGVYLDGPSRVDCCTIATNDAALGGGMYCRDGMIINSIIYHNAAASNANIHNDSVGGQYEHSCMTPLMVGTGNISAAPQFVDVEYGDFRLASSSPCINRGKNEPWMGTSKDLAGHDRMLDGTVDMGCLEHTGLTYAITAIADMHGTVFPTQAVVVSGGSVTFYIYPDPGYHVEDVLVNNQSVGVTNSYAFHNVHSNQFIEVLFGLDYFQIAVTSEVNGIIMPSSKLVGYGSNAVFSVQADAGFHIENVFVDGTPVGVVSNITFSMVTNDHTLAVICATNVPTVYPINTAAGAHGSIWPTNPLVPAGSDQPFSILPDAGYHVVEVSVDGFSMGAVSNYVFTNVQDTHTIAATFATNPPLFYTVTTLPGTNGIIAPMDPIVSAGDDISFSISPDPGYHIADVVVDGTGIGAVTGYTFLSVNDDHVLSATFATNLPVFYTITALAGSNGMVLPSSASVSAGGSRYFDILPDTGYYVEDVTVDGVSVGAVTGYLFAGVTTSHVLTATFATNPVTYEISAVAGINGTISPSNAVVPYSGGQSFTITPDAGYLIYEMAVNGEPVAPTGMYHFAHVRSNQTLSASFLAVTSRFAITVTAGPHGEIVPSNAMVTVGGNQTFAVLPDSGCRIDDVWVNGVSIGPQSAFTFHNVRSNQSITAQFIPQPIGVIAGHVQASSSLPVTNARIQLRNPLHAVIYEEYADSAGEFMFVDVPSGNYYLKVEADRYADEWYDGADGARFEQQAAVLAVSPGTRITNMNFMLDPGQSPALVRVTASSTGLPVYLDFQAAGLSTPALIDIGEISPAYAHAVWVSDSTMGIPAPREIHGVEAETVPMYFPLTSYNPGTVSVYTEPAGAAVYLDRTDAPIGETPIEITGLMTGTHMIIIRKEEYLDPWPIEINISGGDDIAVDIPLTRKYLLREDFSDGLAGWIPFGSPAGRIVSVHGRASVFDNNGDAVCDSGIVSDQALDLTGGAYISADVLLEVMDWDRCWAHASIGLSLLEDNNTWCEGYDHINLIEFALLGHECTQVPEAERGHACIWGPGMNPTAFIADDFVNGWHQLLVSIEPSGVVDLYLDEQYIGRAAATVNIDTLHSAHIMLGSRSSGAGGKAYIDNLLVKPDITEEQICVFSSPSNATVYLDYLPTDKATDTFLNGMDPLAYSGVGWQSVSHRVMLYASGYLPTAPRQAPPDVEVELVPATADFQPAFVFRRRGGTPVDYDGDRVSDLACYHSPSGQWYLQKSREGSDIVQFGYEQTCALAGDYDGDGLDDMAVYAPGAGTWYVLRSADGRVDTVSWGWSAAQPVSADYNGDGITDIAIYEPASGMWYLRLSGGESPRVVMWGWSAAQPVPADFDGDACSDLAVYWPDGGLWYVLRSSDGRVDTVSWGWSAARPVPGDYDGDGRADVAVFAPETGNWFIRQSADGVLRVENWGWNEATPFAADVDGDGQEDMTVYGSAEAIWYLLQSSEGARMLNLGVPASRPVQ